MKVLWLTNNPLPDVCEYLNIPTINKTGWLHSAANQIKGHVELSIMSLYHGDSMQEVNIGNISYYLLPSQNIKHQLRTVCERVNPDIIHIHGTEYSTGLHLFDIFRKDRIIISIQGLISEVSKHYNFGLSSIDILRHSTLRDIIKRNTLWNQAARFKKSGLNEIKYLKQGIHYIGRTDWDCAHIKASNSNAQYHHNNETLRQSFYDACWNIEKADKHSIFFSQATYPLKGLHQLLNALPIVLKKYPDTRIRVAGYDLTRICSSTAKARLRATTYGFYLKSLIKKLHLTAHVEFLGDLTETQIRDNYLHSHVYVNASALENSSNSIGEAQLLGVPVVASFVGGTDSIVTNNLSGLLYPADDTIRLASSIIRIFDSPELAQKLSEGGRKEAMERHNRTTNMQELLKIYRSVISE